MKLGDLSNKKPIIIFVLFLFSACFFTSCTEKRTVDAQEAYKYWAGRNASTDIQLLRGQYWQSAHFSKEYKVYLKFKTSKIWWDEFLKQNTLVRQEEDWAKPSTAPEWFSPSSNSVRYGKNDDFDQGSSYFQDTLTNVCYLYEIQL